MLRNRSFTFHDHEQGSRMLLKCPYGEVRQGEKHGYGQAVALFLIEMTLFNTPARNF